jgi:hypothetical protein
MAASYWHVVHPVSYVIAVCCRQVVDERMWGDEDKPQDADAKYEKDAPVQASSTSFVVSSPAALLLRPTCLITMPT